MLDLPCLLSQKKKKKKWTRGKTHEQCDLEIQVKVTKKYKRKFTPIIKGKYFVFKQYELKIPCILWLVIR